MRGNPVSRGLLCCGLVLLLTANVARAQEPKLPEGLKHVPADALGFVHIRAGELLKSDHGKTLLAEIRKDREASKGLKEIEKTLGIAAEDLESVTLLMLVPPTRGMNPGGFGPRGPMYDKKPDIFPPPKAEGKLLLEMKLIELQRREEEARRRAEEEAKRAIEELKRLERELKERENKQESPVLLQEHSIGTDQGIVIQDDPFDDHAGPGEPLIIVTSAKALDRKQILRNHFLAGPGRDPFGPAEHHTVLFVSDRSVLIGSPWGIGRYSEATARKPKGEPLKSALTLAAEGHMLSAGGYVPAELRRLLFTPFGPDIQRLATIAPLLMTEAGLTVDLGKSVNVKLQFQAPNEASAANAFQAVKSLRVIGELAIEKSREAGESGGAKLELEKALIKGLADATIEQKALTVHAELKLELGPNLYKKFMKDIIAQLRSRGDRALVSNNLKQIALALHNYHDANRTLPPAGISDAAGKPLLSWRVAILPYIEQQALYQQFDLTQPWDHPTNKALIAKIPAIYLIPGVDAREGHTHLRVLVGPGTMFEPRMGPGGRAVGNHLARIPDGTANTFMVLEAAESTVWTRPDDLPLDPKGPLPKLGTSPDGFHAAMGDGSVRFVRSTTSSDIWRVYLTGNNGIVRQPLD